MTRRRRSRAVAELRTLRAPGEALAEQRAWEVARSVYAERAAVRRRRVSPAATLVPVILLAAVVLALTPAGAAVHRWIELTLGVRHASPALFALPASGDVLVSGSSGAWTVATDGSRHRLGSWREASFSPHGLYVVVASRNELAAVDPHGVQAWALARPNVSSPRWFAPDGYQVAYLSGTSLRVVAGNGANDRLLVARVRHVAPAWRNGYAYQLAYVTPDGKLALRDAGSRQLLWTRSLPSPAGALAWSPDGSRLLVRTDNGAIVLDGGGRVLASIEPRAGGSVLDAALAPDARTVALLTDRELTLTTLPPAALRTRQLFSGPGLRQVVFSPDSRWLLVSWPAADQWIFVHASGSPRIAAASRIAEQFGQRSVPTLDGWCCTTQ